MSEKVTFGELIESIANETDNSKKFTHDFLKDFVSVINSGLEDDGRVNIAGFGKFELRQMDEREGYNPQTGEQMTIPAQNKVVFKPYKELRELVNAPYAHLESELIEEDTEPQENIREQEKSVQQTEQREQETDSETSDETETNTAQEERQEKQPEETSQINTPSFVWDGPESDETSQHDQPETRTDEEQEESEDIVAFDKTDKHEEQRQPERQKEISTDTDASSPKPKPATSKNKDASVWGIAAVIALIIIVTGAWLMTSSNNTGGQSQPVASAAVQQENETGTHQQESTSSETQQSQPETPASVNTQSQNNQPVSSATPSPTQQNQQVQQQTESLEIDEGQTLWSIAENNFEDPYLWPWIYEANKSSVNNPNLIVAGNSLTLPIPDLPDYNLSSTDSLEVAIGYVETYRWHKEQETDSAKFYLWAAQMYDQEVFEHIDRPIDKEDLAFVNRVR